MGEGTVTVTASQGGNGTYAAATDVVRTITVVAAVGMQAQTITFTSPVEGQAGSTITLGRHGNLYGSGYVCGYRSAGC